MGKKNIASKFIRKKIIMIRKNLGKNKVEAEKSKKSKKVILPFEIAKNEPRDEQKYEQKSKVKNVEENYFMTS